jgi:hypothetical protein
MTKPQIILPDVGAHNRDLAASRTRLLKGQSYRDLSTVCVIPLHPGREGIHPRVVQAFMNLIPPMNQKFTRIFLTNMEVGDAYTSAVEMILANPELSTWKFLLTCEDDNLPPPDGLLKLYESIEQGPYDAVGGLYWTKGEMGQPMVYGNPTIMPRNFIPQPPMPGTVQPCNGLGQGFTLFRLSMFKDTRFKKPWFKTVQELVAGGARAFTQDLYFFDQACGLGYKFASDNRVLVGHLDLASGMVW